VTCRVLPIPPGSAEPLSLLQAECFPEDPWDVAALERILALAGAFGFCAWQSDIPVAFVLVRDLRGEFEILSIGVLPAWRRCAIATKLLQAVFAEAERRESVSVVLEVAHDNPPARRLYAGMGFEQVGRRPRYYNRASGQADALILRRMTRAGLRTD
jgi:ribosomal-protein-alanine N-acetyltransferase